MKLLLETDSIGGVWTFTLRLADALRAAGHHVVIAAQGPGLTADQQAQAQAAADVVASWSTRLEWEPDCDDDELEAAGNWLRALCDTHRIDVAHLCSFAHAARPTWPCARLLTVHSDITTWWHSVHGEAPPPMYDRYRQRVRAAAQRVDGLAFVSHAHRDQFHRMHPGLSPREGHRRAATGVVYAGLPEAATSRRVPRLSGTRPRPEPVAFAAGRFDDDGKNLAALAAVAERLGPRLRLAGDFAAEPGSAAADHPAFANATRLGRLSPESVLREMSAASVFLSPSRYEPYGLAALEAASSGCALVLSDIPTYRELWDGAALFAPTGDAGAWGDAVDAVLATPERRRHLLQAASANAAGRTASRTAKAYLDLYAAACRARTGGPGTPATTSPARSADLVIRTRAPFPIDTTGGTPSFDHLRSSGTTPTPRRATA